MRLPAVAGDLAAGAAGDQISLAEQHLVPIGQIAHALAIPDLRTKGDVGQSRLFNDLAQGGLGHRLARMRAAANGEPGAGPGAIVGHPTLHQQDAILRIKQQDAHGQALGDGGRTHFAALIRSFSTGVQ